MGGCHSTLTHRSLQTRALEEGGGGQHHAVPLQPCKMVSLSFYHTDSHFPIAVATSSMATGHLLSQMCPPHPWSPLLEKQGGCWVWCEGLQGRVNLQLICQSGASLFALSCPVAHRIKGTLFSNSLKGEQAGLLWRLPASSCPLGPGWAQPGAGSCYWGYLGAPGAGHGGKQL